MNMFCFGIDFLRKIELIFCEYGEKIELLNEEKMKKICGYHKLLIRFGEIMNNEFFSKRKKM